MLMPIRSPYVVSGGGGGSLTFANNQNTSIIGVSGAASISMSIGDAATNRYVFVVMGGTSQAITAVSIAGITATKMCGLSAIPFSSIWYALVPTGTTATISVSGIFYGAYSQISTYSATNINSITPVSSGTGTAVSATPFSITSQNGGFIIGSGGFSYSSMNAITVSGATVNNSSTTPTYANRIFSTTTTSASTSITMTNSLYMSNMSYCFVSMR